VCTEYTDILSRRYYRVLRLFPHRRRRNPFFCGETGLLHLLVERRSELLDPRHSLLHLVHAPLALWEERQHTDTHRQTDRPAGRQTGRKADRQTDRQADRQRERHTHTHTYTHSIIICCPVVVLQSDLRSVAVAVAVASSCYLWYATPFPASTGPADVSRSRSSPGYLRRDRHQTGTAWPSRSGLPGSRATSKSHQQIWLVLLWLFVVVVVVVTKHTVILSDISRLFSHD